MAAWSPMTDTPRWGCPRLLPTSRTWMQERGPRAFLPALGPSSAAYPPWAWLIAQCLRGTRPHPAHTRTHMHTCNFPAHTCMPPHAHVHTHTATHTLLARTHAHSPPPPSHEHTLVLPLPLRPLTRWDLPGEGGWWLGLQTRTLLVPPDLPHTVNPRHLPEDRCTHLQRNGLRAHQLSHGDIGEGPWLMNRHHKHLCSLCGAA